LLTTTALSEPAAFQSLAHQVLVTELDERLVEVVRKRKGAQAALRAFSPLHAQPAADEPRLRRSSSGSDCEEATSAPAPPDWWEAQRRYDHSKRLLQAASNASARAARKMISLAATEQLGTTTEPAVGALAEPRRVLCLREPSGLVECCEGLHASVSSVSYMEFAEDAELGGDEDDEPDGARRDPPDGLAHMVRPQAVWQCLVLGLHSMLGCDAALRA